EDREIEGFACRSGQRRRKPRRDGHHLVAKFGQHAFEQNAKQQLVLDDENAFDITRRRCAHLAPSPPFRSANKLADLRRFRVRLRGRRKQQGTTKPARPAPRHADLKPKTSVPPAGTIRHEPPPGARFAVWPRPWLTKTTNAETPTHLPITG